jgi:hypothetical protein
MLLTIDRIRDIRSKEEFKFGKEQKPLGEKEKQELELRQRKEYILKIYADISNLYGCTQGHYSVHLRNYIRYHDDRDKILELFKSTTNLSEDLKNQYYFLSELVFLLQELKNSNQDLDVILFDNMKLSDYIQLLNIRLNLIKTNHAQNKLEVVKSLIYASFMEELSRLKKSNFSALTLYLS